MSRSEQPVVECYASDACGVTDWLESISLAAEKPSISQEEMLKAEQEAKAAMNLLEQSGDE